MMIWLRNIISNVLHELANAVKRTPLFIWIYLSIVAYAARKLTYHYGYTRRKMLVRGRVIYVSSAEEGLVGDIVNFEDIDTSFGDIGGLDDVKTALIEHVKWPFTRPELFEGNTLRSHPKGILLYGPPGTGKTLLARSLAKELGCTFINVKSESLFSKWVGDTERNSAAVFTLAEKLSPCVIFIDEIDALLGTRTSMDAAHHTNTKTTFMTNWDGIIQSKSKIVVIGATNRPLSIDDAIRRRLPLQLEVPPPAASERKKILDILLRHDVQDKTARDRLIDYIASRTANCTGSDLTELCKAAALIPIRELREDGRIPSLERRHFEEAFKRVRPSLG
ncbi:unnamed protein product [Trypanosoma congolense IL3000]|uniref:WGS project CAEQ00000000 data, annotated contig 1911 n=1 Tax=Trypanosoma congolense (strain IL3000) TaxID=1068625 RepID=F9W9Y8_TRYCI|nr:unnamed protein product [Trypanosoma congolense IL3000]